MKIKAYGGKERQKRKKEKKKGRFRELYITTSNSFVDGLFTIARTFVLFMYLFIVGP